MIAKRIGALAFALALAASAFGCKRPRSAGFGEEPKKGESAAAGPGLLIELDLTSGVAESTDGGGLFPLPASRTYAGLLRALERSEGNDRTTGFFLRLGLEGELGWAKAEELGRVLEALRNSGKPVVCHAHALTNATTWLALRGCDRVWVSPAGELETVGIASQLIYFKRAFDKFHVRADFEQIGKYKGAAEPFTREGPSDEARESLTSTLASIRQSWLEGVGSARPAGKVRESLEHGPWSAQEAKARGLIDEVGFESEAREDAKKRAEAAKVNVAFGRGSRQEGALNLAEIIRILSGADERAGGRPRVAVVPAEGGITMGGGGLFEGGIAERALNKTLRRLAREDAVKAVVLRIDSPGGSALASDLIWHELTELRKKKPVIASVGNMAASGGYYMACAANRVIAETTSIVGSIGVVGGKVVVDGLLDEIGVDSMTFAASPAPGAAERAAYLSPLVAWDDATRARVRREMQAIYDLFIERCATGRGLPGERIRASAEGRIFSGLQAKERGLVDEIGGLSRALSLARELGKLGDDAPVVVEGAAESLLELLMMDDGANESEVARAATRLQARQNAVLRLVPRRAQPFFESMTPLFAGERTATARPFAMLVD